MTDEEVAAMFAQLEPKLHSIAKSYLPCHADQQDAVQECFCRVWLNRNTLVHAECFRTWVMRIMKNECINVKRKMNNASLPLILDDTPCKDRALENLLEYDALYIALKRVKEEERSLIHLRYFDGYMLKEISAITNQPIGTIQSKVYRSLRKLRRYLSI